MTTKASDLFIPCLENEGVEYIFGVPGEENLDLLDSLSRSSIQLVLTRHEQTAGFMAATYGRLTGKTGVCLATLGRGANTLAASRTTTASPSSSTRSPKKAPSCRCRNLHHKAIPLKGTRPPSPKPSPNPWSSAP